MINHKAQVRLTNIFIGVLVVSLIITLSMTFLFDVGNKYGSDQGNLEDDKLVQMFNNESKNQIEQLEITKDKLQNVAEGSNVFDRIGALFSSGYSAVKNMFSVIDSTDRLIGETTARIPFLGTSGTAITTVLVGIILVIIIGIFLHFLIKSEYI